MPETPANHQHEPHVPLPVEIPVTTDLADDAMDLKTQIIRFVATGGLSAVVDYGLYVLLLALGLPRIAAKSLSFVAGTTTAYLINRRWTFKAEPSRTRFIAVVVLYAVTFGIQVWLNELMNQVFDDQWWSLPLAFVIAQGTATVINFIVQRAVIFKIK
ncbi:GtrA family protein [Rhodococcus sp. ARC_M6]|nr:GtrA family protein [Rhodococcus sp. ARC_M6]MCJ0904380.1 GtrA family protein [Rhodococcus sp. ARC_M6]